MSQSMGQKAPSKTSLRPVIEEEEKVPTQQQDQSKSGIWGYLGFGAGKETPKGINVNDLQSNLSKSEYVDEPENKQLKNKRQDGFRDNNEFEILQRFGADQSNHYDRSNLPPVILP